MDKSNLQQLIKEVVQNNKDLGVIFDGDADRVAFTDETGLPISPDLMIAMLGHHFLEKEKGEVVVDIRTSRSVVEYLNHLGARVHMWKVGRAFASPKLKEINGIFGGELAGHYYFRDFYYSDSGILALLFLLEVFQKMKARGKRVSDCIRQINRYHNSGELNFVVENKTEAINALCRHFLAGENPLGIMDFDGYRYDFSDWWFNVRTSNTEPYLRLVIEAAQQATLQEKTEQAVKVLQAFLA